MTLALYASVIHVQGMGMHPVIALAAVSQLLRATQMCKSKNKYKLGLSQRDV
jgi:hypothetical protein